MSLNIKDGIDFTEEEAAWALLNYAAKNGANVPVDASEIKILKAGSRLRAAGVFLSIRLASGDN